MKRLRPLAVGAGIVLLAAAVPVAIHAAGAAGPELACSSGFSVDQTFDNGATWELCWTKVAREGIVLHQVTYTPPGGSAVEVLGQMNLAQIHVPYDNNAARFHDESDYGLGSYMLDLDAADCPGGTLLDAGTSDGEHDYLCRTVADTGYTYKDYESSSQKQTLSLFSASAIGAYNYIVAWNFDDDGTIRPEVGATGSLQMYGGNTTTGWNVGNGSIAVAHLHNFYWRLDFDINGPSRDRVQELQATRSGSRLNNTRTDFTTETRRRVGPAQMRSWRIRDDLATNADGHLISWELLPNTDNIFRGPDFEPFTQNELYVTRSNPNERFASHNLAGGGSGADNVSAFVNGQSLTNQDLTVWYGTSFHHLPRDEDEPHMHAHWSGFTIVPRDLTATNVES